MQVPVVWLQQFNLFNYILEIIVKLIISYLIGSISGSILFGKLKKVDVRNTGSGNAGGTNAFRTMGAAFGIIVLCIDILKGFVAVKYLPLLKIAPIITLDSINIELLSIVCGIGVVLGHVYPIYHSFKGGKGAGALVGVLLVLFPMGLLFCLISWFIILVFTGFVGLSTMIASALLPLFSFFLYSNGINSPFGYFSILITIFIIYTHKKNIQRMINGNENQFRKIMIFSRNKN